MAFRRIRSLLLSLMDGLRSRLLRLPLFPGGFWIQGGYPGHFTTAAAIEVGREHGQALDTVPRSCPRVLDLESQSLPVEWQVLLPVHHAGYLILGAGFTEMTFKHLELSMVSKDKSHRDSRSLEDMVKYSVRCSGL